MRRTSSLILALVITSCGQPEDPRGFRSRAEEPAVPRGAAALTGEWQRSRFLPAAPALESVPAASLEPARLVVLADPVALELAGRVLEEPFERACPGIDLVLWETSGRSPVVHVVTGNADAALIAGELPEPEYLRGMAQLLLGYHIPALVCHPSNGTASLDLEQARFLLTGEAGDWGWLGRQTGVPVLVFPSLRAKSDLCGEILIPGHVLSRSGPRLDTDQEILEEVQRNPASLGLVSAASLGETGVGVLAIDGASPTFENFLRGTYPYGRKVQLVYRGCSRAVLRSLVEFARSPEGRRILARTLSAPR